MPKNYTENEQKAIRKAMQLLEYRDRSVRELSDRLKKVGFEQNEIDTALEYVRSYGYLNDERYASNFVYGKAGSKSRRKILQELEQKGIDRETARAAYEETAAHYEIDERAILRETILRKVPEHAQLDEKKYRSLMGYLGRRGFTFEDIQAVLRELQIERDFSEYR